MAELQKYFEIFHERIRADYDMDATLREKRDKILKRIRKYLAHERVPSFDPLLQGSYKLRTGVQPIGSIKFDIDVGLRFNLSSDDYTPSTVRGWILEAVEGHTDEIEDKGPCIRVIYASDYHVDLVVYGKPASQGSNVLMLGHRDLGWRDANPVGLEVFVDSARIPYEGTADSRTSTDQFRRVVRYLKRWYDEAIPHDSERKPSGLAYTLLVAAQGAPPHLNFEGLPDDLEALAALAAYGADAQGRLNVQKPTPEYEDLLEGLSDAAMNALKRRFSSLRDALAEAKEIVDPVEACTLLHRNEYLGRDFPIPKRSDTAKKSAAPAFVPASTSA